MIVKRINLRDFVKEFKKYGRDQYSNSGYEALFEYLEELSEDIGQPIELDPIAICCEFTEYESLVDVIEEYGIDDIEDLDDLEYYTTVIEFDGGIIIQDF